MVGKSVFAVNRCYKGIVVMMVSFVFILSIYLMLNTSKFDVSTVSIFGNHREIDLPSYKYSRKEYFQHLSGYPTGSYLPSGSNLQLLLSDPSKSQLRNEYPVWFKLGDLLKRWPANNTHKDHWRYSPAHLGKGEGLFRLNYGNETERKLAFSLRSLDLPFVVYNIPELNKAASDVFTYENLLDQFGKEHRVVERSETNEFLYFSAKNPSAIYSRFSDWKPPQEDISMTFQQFAYEAEKAEKFRRDDISGNSPLYYLIVNAGEVRAKCLFFLFVLCFISLYREEEPRG
jgi:hypothetical protein